MTRPSMTPSNGMTPGGDLGHAALLLLSRIRHAPSPLEDHDVQIGGWIDVRDAAARLGSTSGAVYRLIDEGALPAFRINRAIRLRISDVDAYVEATNSSPRPPRRGSRGVPER
jgi:excisionase family DNA binding protein